MSKIREWQEKARKAEEERIGDIYNECVKRGCDIRFLKNFDSRIWLYPIEQTTVFLDRRKNAKEVVAVDNHLKQWKFYLQVIIEKRPNHEKADEWKKALKMLG